MFQNISVKQVVIIVLTSIAFTNTTIHAQQANLIAENIKVNKSENYDTPIEEAVKSNQKLLISSDYVEESIFIEDESYDSSTKKAYILNEYGEVVWEDLNFYKTVKVDLRQLKKGKYYVKVFSREKIITREFVKK